ncbi:MAG: hypothetical protein V1726_07530 [Methanobacteriota archaeon]
MISQKLFLVVLSVVCVCFLVSPVSGFSLISSERVSGSLVEGDLDPLVDLSVTVTIQAIRSLEKLDQQIPAIEKIDWFSDPDFYVVVYIDGEKFTSPVWKNTKYLYDLNWSATLNVPDDQDWVSVDIELWDWNVGVDRLCDISNVNAELRKRNNSDANLLYNLRSGHWYVDDSLVMDWMFDESGYGRLNGCDDGSFYQRDLDCELWFDISQNDFDNDGIPYWAEVNVYGTDPMVDNRGEDNDGDGVPIEWEHKWGHYLTYDYVNDSIGFAWEYTDFVWDDHRSLDPDNDGLDNYEEYLTSQWGSDPFRKDLFVELDQMDQSPDGFRQDLPVGAQELIRTAFDRRNIVFHLDDGSMGGGETIPFQAMVNRSILVDDIYWNYFLHGNTSNWRRGVFHYGVVVYQADYNGYTYLPDAFQISSYGLETNKTKPKTGWKRDIVFGSAYMHELGHTLGFDPIGGHDEASKYPWQLSWWKWRPYKSIMNYGYMYKMVDYSDGSRGKNDFNDWSPDRLDLTFFQREDWG